MQHDSSYDTPDTFAHLFFCLNGRIGRGHFWLGWIAIILVSLIVQFIDSVLPFGIIAFIACVLMLWPMIAVSVKRCHDHDKSGWWCLMVLIPVYGIFFLVVFLGFMRGTDDANRFGLPVIPLRAS